VSLRLTHGMVLAAGLGSRMRPLTDRVPKPLVPVSGRTLLDRALDRFADAGLSAVVNVHHHAEQIERHLAGRAAPTIAFSRETRLLETGGGVALALPLLGRGPFAVANGDALWLDGPTPALARLAAAWDGRRMDALLLVHSVTAAPGYEGRGDFFMDPRGRLERRGDRRVAPFLFAGVQILDPALFAGEPAAPWSLNRVYDKALAAGRLYGLRHDGLWFHVGDVAGLRATEEILRTLDRPSRRR
jgi:N-acetyl-alpha-D-muramate 1-phosphate uridylyltransferase